MSHIRIEGLHKSYGDIAVLSDIHLDVQHGELLTLLGPSGCGKSTLLRTISGLTPADAGRIYMDNQTIDDIPSHLRGIGMIFQQYSLFPAMTVYENVAFGLEQQKLPRTTIDEKVEKVLESVRMSLHRDKYPIQLSGGEQQRVALARSLVTSPKVLLLDEPFSAIDAALRADLQQELLELHKIYDMTMVFVTHDQDEAMLLSDHIVLMNQGRIVQYGTPEELYRKPVNRFAAEFIGRSNIVEWEFDDKRQWCSLRPERIKLFSKSERIDDRLVALAGHVDSLRQIGGVWNYSIRSPLGILRVHSLIDHDQRFIPGDEVIAVFDPQDLVRID